MKLIGFKKYFVTENSEITGGMFAVCYSEINEVTNDITEKNTVLIAKSIKLVWEIRIFLLTISRFFEKYF
jgi:hypothetical protein